MIYLTRKIFKNGRIKLVRSEKETNLRLNILASRLEEFDGAAWKAR